MKSARIKTNENNGSRRTVDEKEKSVGLQVNGEKTKYMLSSLRASSQERVGPKVNIGNHYLYIWLEQMNAFKTIITENKGEALPPANYASFTQWE